METLSSVSLTDKFLLIPEKHGALLWAVTKPPQQSPHGKAQHQLKAAAGRPPASGTSPRLTVLVVPFLSSADSEVSESLRDCHYQGRGSRCSHTRLNAPRLRVSSVEPALLPARPPWLLHPLGTVSESPSLHLHLSLRPTL